MGMAYWKDRKNQIILFFSMLLIFAALFYLYGLPVSGVLYGVLLGLVILGIFGIGDFMQWRKKLEDMKRMKAALPYFTVLDMPLASTSIEEAYQEVIKKFERVYGKMQDETFQGKTELSDFYTLWVHQIKTPIAAMRLLLQEEDTEGQRALAQELFKVEQYVEMVLGYLRIESISSDLVLERCQLEKIINQAVKKYAPVFIHKKIAITLFDLNATVLTDGKWLQFVVEQLLSNGLKYTAEGEIRIFLKDKQTLVIQDTGIGIAAEDLPRIFERGFTGFNGHLDKKSTGLGLYLCKKTLDRLHHKITIISAPSEGTRVEICLGTTELVVE